MAYNLYDTTLSGPRTINSPRLTMDRKQWERLNEAFGEALVNDAVGTQLLAGDPVLLNRHRVNGEIQMWIKRVAARTLDDLAQRILIELGG